ncbi:hypothetical protein [Pyruvatibacter sp.]|uniref:hypothetical protein n=1 Tax=Pyruvatibacter sp. TaxID=1981328 RepID=UPI0032EB3DD7
MGDVIRLPLDRITDRDRTRLFQAAAASPLDVDLVTNDDGSPCVLAYRCGWTHPSFRIEKSDGLWQAFDLEHGGTQPVFQSRLASDLIDALSTPVPLENRPTAS